MTADPTAVAVSLMTADVDPQQQPQPQEQPVVTSLAEPPHHPEEPIKPKTPGSSRRGKQYKCGHCHELGHNQKTCPRRASACGEAAIQPALGVDASELFGGVASNVAPALPASVTGNGHHHHHPPPHLPVTRVQPAKLEAALEAANKRVMAADKQVASATTEPEFEEATSALDFAVRHLEKVASCAQRCAVIAHNLCGSAAWDGNQGVSEREPKRMRLEGATSPTALTPTNINMNESTPPAPTETAESPGEPEVKEEIE